MKRNLQVSLLAGALILTGIAGAAFAQTRRGTAPAQKAAGGTNVDALAGLTLPASDSVAIVEMRRLLSEALPRALADDPAKLAEVNADIDNFKAKTGIDPRAFDTLAAGSRIVPLPNGKVKLDHTVAVARGTFNASTIVSAGRAAAKGAHREEKYAGKSVHVFTLNEQLKLFGLLNMRVRELAVAELSANTLAVGEPAAVRAAIDAGRGRGALKAADLTMLTQPRGANTLVAFGSRVPSEATRGLDFGNPQVAQAIASVRELYGTVGSTANGLDMQTNLRTMNAADARNLSETLAALKQLAPLFLGRLQGDKGRLARNAVDSLRVTTQGNEVQLRLEVPQADVTTLLRTL